MLYGIVYNHVSKQEKTHRGHEEQLKEQRKHVRWT